PERERWRSSAPAARPGPCAIPYSWQASSSPPVHTLLGFRCRRVASKVTGVMSDGVDLRCFVPLPMQRSARKRCEASTEDDARVGEVGVGNDALSYLFTRLGHQRRNKPLRKVGRWRARRLFDSLSILPGIEAFAGLAAQFLAGEMCLQALRHRVVAGKLPPSCSDDIQADGVR